MAKQKIMIVDDDLAFSQMVSEYFRTHGYEVNVANNLEDAILVFRRVRPTVVLMDYNMPIVNGDKFLPILQELEAKVKAIVISGCTEEDVEQRFRGLGYYAFFEKAGLSLEKVKAKVDEALAG